MIPKLLFSAFFFANAFAILLAGHEQQQQPLGNGVSSSTAHSAGGAQRLTGRFLHITGMLRSKWFTRQLVMGFDILHSSVPDPHPDSHYKRGASSDNNCHRGHGSAGYFGAVGTDCDAPLILMNATFRWIEQNLKGNIDFVLWTGDSARHDRDEKTPRTMEEIIYLNEILSQKFIDVFQDSIPVVPTIGNNDIMPHNTMKEGPNRWTKTFLDVWGKFIPESERHSFVEGGWFTSEVIPGKLAAISLNTMYFYSSNSAVDGCDDKDEPGYEHMEWLRIQLKLLRQRKMKAILIGHVPPARAGSKQGWDETCWQKYTLWLHQYRDVIVGSVYGHMNIDHFIFQDSHDIDIVDLEGDNTGTENFSIQSIANYLDALRDQWSDMPSPPSGLSIEECLDEDFAETDGDGLWTDISKKRKKKKKFLRKIGGPLAERYSVSLVSPSLVPTYFPTLRVIEYNITDLEDTPIWSDIQENTEVSYPDNDDIPDVLEPEDSPIVDIDMKKKKKKKPKKPNFKVPEPPPSSALPGPGYSNQPLSWLGYTQYYANLTRINEEMSLRESMYRDEAGNNVNFTSVDDVFDFEVEYDTLNDHIYKMKDLTVRSFFDLASRIANNIPNTLESPADTNDGDCNSQKKKKKKGKKKKNKAWKTFLDRAFVGYLDINNLEETES